MKYYIISAVLPVLLFVHQALSQSCTIRQITGTNDYCVFLLDGQIAPDSAFGFAALTGVLTLRRAGLWQIRYQNSPVCFSGNVADVRGVTTLADFTGPLMSVFIQGRNVTGPINLQNAITSGPRTFRILLTDGGSLQANVSAGLYTLDESSIAGDIAANATLQVGAIGNTPDVELNIGGNLRGRLDVLGDIGPGGINSIVRIAGNVQDNGKISVGGALRGTIDIDGDVLWSTSMNTWIRIEHIDGGTFSCRDMQLRRPSAGDIINRDWFVLGFNTPPYPDHLLRVHSGSIDIGGVLSGRLFMRGRCGLNIQVNTINAPKDIVSGTDEGYGGIRAAAGYASNSTITVGTFTQGEIGYPNVIQDVAPPETSRVLPMGGTIHVTGNMGTPTTTARIASVGVDVFPAGVDVDRDITGSILIDGDLYGAQDALSAIETDNLSGQIYINGSLLNGAAAATPELRVRGTVQSGAAISIDYDGWDVAHD